MSTKHNEKTSGSVIQRESPKQTTMPGARIAAARGGGTRIDWARLLKRVFDLDILACPCSGRLRILAEITERSAIDRILNHLGEPRDGPMPGRVWDPMLCDMDLPPPDW